MEHIIITGPDKNEMYRLIPEEGYRLYNKMTQTVHSEALTRTPKIFEAIPV